MRSTSALNVFFFFLICFQTQLFKNKASRHFHLNFHIFCRTSKLISILFTSSILFFFPSSNTYFKVLIKTRIFVFTSDDLGRRFLPKVCRKWRDGRDLNIVLWKFHKILLQYIFDLIKSSNKYLNFYIKKLSWKEAIFCARKPK